MALVMYKTNAPKKASIGLPQRVPLDLYFGDSNERE